MATAASKRKQDEKHLKLLRETVALPHNKQCFDCHQRGPTYVNMTVGSFVCTSCSGILRGLNPPHRVKSISMTTFTPDEMEFLKSRGNEFCRKVWLSRFNASVHREPDYKDEHKVKEFMSDKYEKKRFHNEATEALHEEARRMNTPPTKPDMKSIRTITGNSLPALKVQSGLPASGGLPQPPTAPSAGQATARPAVSHPTIQQPASQPPVDLHKKQTGFDLLSDLGADPFGGPAVAKPAPKLDPPAAAGGFADFSSFSSAGVTSPPQTTPTFPAASGVLQPMNPTQQPSSVASPAGSFSAFTPSAPSAVPTNMSAADKYAALASLDTAFGGGPGGNASVSWDGQRAANSGVWNSSGGTSVFGSSPGNNLVGLGQPANAAFGAPTSTSDGQSWYLNGVVHSHTLSPTNPFYMHQPALSASNPFGTSPPGFSGPNNVAAQPPTGNPFMTAPGGAGFGQPATGPGGASFGQPAPVSYNQQPAANFASFSQPASTGFAQFGTNQAPGYSVAGGQAFGMQNGGFGMQQQGFGVPAQSQFGGNLATASSSQLGAKMVPPGGYAQQQQFASWGAPPQQAAGNPFMSAVPAQQAVAPRGNSTNPFL